MHMIYKMEKVQQKPSHSFNLGFCFSFAKFVVKSLISFFVLMVYLLVFLVIFIYNSMFLFSFTSIVMIVTSQLHRARVKI